MNAPLRIGALCGAACLTGVLAGNLICASMTIRNAIGIECGRGALIALADGVGLYQCDLARAEAEFDGRNPESDDEEGGADRRPGPSWPVIAANLEAERMAGHEAVSRSAINREMDLLRFQLPPQGWLAALRSNGLSTRSLRCAVMENLRARSWLEGQIQADLAVPPEECAAYYNAHPGAYAQPARLRASHIFFAAPPESSDELVEQKRAAAQDITDRLSRGEKFADLVGYSEDEASKKRGGDLNFFAEVRMPADFWAALQDRKVGQAPGVMRTQLGFHVVQLTDARPARQMSLEEARPEILARLEGEKRSRLISALAEKLVRKVEWNQNALGLADLPTR